MYFTEKVFETFIVYTNTAFTLASSNYEPYKTKAMKLKKLQKQQLAKKPCLTNTVTAMGPTRAEHHGRMQMAGTVDSSLVH